MDITLASFLKAKKQTETRKNSLIYLGFLKIKPCLVTLRGCTSEVFHCMTSIRAKSAIDWFFLKVTRNKLIPLVCSATLSATDSI
jgi:hypothetical protein